MNRRKITLLLLMTVALVLAGYVAQKSNSLAQSETPRFVPPDAKARRAAIGSTRNLSPLLRKSLADSDLFSPIPKPQPGDWLASHQEIGQTFAQFVRSHPNRPNQHRHTLYFVPLGKYDEAIAPKIQSLEKFATAFFAMPVKTLPNQSLDGLPIKVRSRTHGPDQLLSTDVLDWLKTRLPEDAYCMLAITMQDLYPDEKWNFVFGQASLNDRVGVYSFVRYTPQFNGTPADDSTASTILKRSCKVLGHETGHMFGIRHCIHFHCLMNGANNLQESDRTPMHLCPVCLRKLQASVNFDVKERYDALLEFNQNAKWPNEAAWIERRIDAID